MTEADAFLAAIIDDPWNDGPRLMYADWLEERGENDRAEFIRVQCEIAGLRGRQDSLGRHIGHTNADKINALSRCERELWPTIGGAILWCGGGWADQLQPHFEWFRRGFVERITCPAADWLAHGAEVLAAQPVLEVELSGLQRWRGQRAKQETAEAFLARTTDAAKSAMGPCLLCNGKLLGRIIEIRPPAVEAVESTQLGSQFEHWLPVRSSDADFRLEGNPSLGETLSCLFGQQSPSEFVAVLPDGNLAFPAFLHAYYLEELDYRQTTWLVSLRLTGPATFTATAGHEEQAVIHGTGRNLPRGVIHANPRRR